MKVLKMVAILSFLLLQGCASSLMKPADGSALVAPPGENSRVVFLRPSSFGGAIQASLFDITGDETRFIGVSSTGTQVVHDVAPGHHRYSHRGEVGRRDPFHATHGRHVPVLAD